MSKKYFLVLTIILLCMQGISAQSGKGRLVDIDGNEYTVTRIGNFDWMCENLRCKHLNTGTPLINITDNAQWINTHTAAFTWYNNNPKYQDSTGLLYNWYAVNTEKLCPLGWHIPSDDEWKNLEGIVDSLYSVGNEVWNESGLRGSNVAVVLKATDGWRDKYPATDSYGFSALPGGEYLTAFHGYGTSGFWWTSTESDSTNAWYRNMVYSFDNIDRNTHPKTMGFSVRCVRAKTP
ncbi:MAG: fibrobacter succinogenes major paralogous domain-containing protein [Ignavibacteria bacterium]|nr:fibrobacter succinogenes major paralogous domain-containing protein [Ignavibacteria bacterium]